MDGLLGALTEIATETAAYALERQLSAVGLIVDNKARLDFVTDADRGAEAFVAAWLAERFPDDGIFGEEGQRKGGSSGQYWIIDPIDGTHNFMRGGRDWAVSIGVSGAGRRAGAIAIPAVGLLLTAATGSGLLVNGAPFVRADPKGDRSLCHTGVSTWMPTSLDHRVSSFVRDHLGLADRRTGSAAVGLVAVIIGESDLYIGFGEHIWDVAGAAILAEAAGLAHTIQWRDEPSEGHMMFLCGDPELVAQARSALSEFDPSAPDRRNWTTLAKI